MKKINKIILTILLCFLCSIKLNALTGYTTGTEIMVRPEPNINSGYIGQIKNQNTVLDVVSEELHNQGDSNCSIGWYQINYNGRVGYVCGNWVSLGNTGDNNPNYNESSYEARIYGTSVSVRREPNYNYGAVTYLLPGANVVILDKTQGSGCSDGWYKVRYYKNDIGYVCGTYVRKIEELTGSNESYENELRNKGFPETYIPYLVKLHELHPTWNFNAINTNVDWNLLISLESGRNYLHKQYINNTVSNIYQIGLSNESGWYIATNEVNAFYLDPRNFLSERFIFMFQQLDYFYGDDNRTSLNRDSEQTKQYYNTITNLLGSSYLNTDEYKYWFIDAGFRYNVSPVYLVSLANQEGTTKETNPSILGTHSSKYNGIYDLNGYYNFFNIGAYTEGSNSPVTRGLAYACGPACTFYDTYNRPWNTREKAIYGGASWIADGYIASGQNTMYFKKFDTSPTSPSSTASHQYQTNVTAPASEAESTYESYADSNLLNEPYTFDIPIYNNMPYVISLPQIASTINTLSMITIDGKNIFNYDQDVVEYTVYVPESYSSVKVEGTKSDAGETVIGLGSIMLTNDTTEHSIVVTAENGSQKTYRITIIKTKDSTSVSDILSNLSVKVNGTTMNHISPNTSASTLIGSILKNSPTAQVTIYTKSGSVITGAEPITTGGSIKIQAPSGEIRTFTTVITGDTTGDGITTILDLLQVQKDIMGSLKLSGASFNAGDIDGDRQITILDLLKIQKYLMGQGIL